MATEKDNALVQFLINGTDNGKIRWEPTARQGQFTTSFKGTYNVTVQKGFSAGEYEYLLRLSDAENEILQVSDNEIGDLVTLFKKAQRTAFSVDSAIDEIMGEGEKKDDIPF